MYITLKFGILTITLYTHELNKRNLYAYAFYENILHSDDIKNDKVTVPRQNL